MTVSTTQHSARDGQGAEGAPTPHPHPHSQQPPAFSLPEASVFLTKVARKPLRKPKNIKGMQAELEMSSGRCVHPGASRTWLRLSTLLRWKPQTGRRHNFKTCQGLKLKLVQELLLINKNGTGNLVEKKWPKNIYMSRYVTKKEVPQPSIWRDMQIH